MGLLQIRLHYYEGESLEGTSPDLEARKVHHSWIGDLPLVWNKLQLDMFQLGEDTGGRSVAWVGVSAVCCYARE